MKQLAERTQHFRDSIFGKMTQLAIKHQAVNLAQGFPDLDLPSFVREELIQAMRSPHHQYAPFTGVKVLREELAKLYLRCYQANYDLETEITVTSGATEGIFLTILTLVNPGDEVILFSPFYDSYAATVKMVGGVVREVPLYGPEFSYRQEEFEKSFSEKTKLVIVNNPHNPSGKVFTQVELKQILTLCKKYDAYLLSDEVYEFLTFDGVVHHSLSKEKADRDRIVVISSMGKTFGATGHKIGYVLASEEISYRLRQVHQYNVFSVSTPFQVAYANALTQLDEYLPQFKQEYQDLRDYFYNHLKKIGFRPILPQGAYFMLCDIENIPNRPKHLLTSDEVAEWLVKDFLVAVVPLPSFYEKESQESVRYVRFCFAKKKSTLDAAIKHLSLLGSL